MTQESVLLDRSVWFTRNPRPDDWAPFEWDEPGLGSQVAGEVAIARASGTSGNLKSGMWRAGPTSPGCLPDGSLRVTYSAPMGDECVLVLEGEATVTVRSTGQTVELTPGTIMCQPKGLEVIWETRPPYFKKYFVSWDSEKVATPSNELIVANINDNPEEWQAWTWDEPAEGSQDCGELILIKETGSTGTLAAGIWRSGKGIHGCNPDGSSTVPYTAPVGDETNIMLEGRVLVRDDETGHEYELLAGDMFGFSSGRHITWTSTGPFVKKFFVLTTEQLPEA